MLDIPPHLCDPNGIIACKYRCPISFVLCAAYSIVESYFWRVDFSEKVFFPIILLCGHSLAYMQILEVTLFKTFFIHFAFSFAHFTPGPLLVSAVCDSLSEVSFTE